ncbi:hypothetical protein DRQ09_08940 [candidate division KSB1 bacterium]|nr:MAG: hypothetical protein DRQ09_08940 [candidate division KSB1 bacterium]
MVEFSTRIGRLVKVIIIFLIILCVFLVIAEVLTNVLTKTEEGSSEIKIINSPVKNEFYKKLLNFRYLLRN